MQIGSKSLTLLKVVKDCHVLTNSRLCLVQCQSYVNICGLCFSQRTDKEKAGACLEKIHVCIVFVSLSTFHPQLVESVVEDTEDPLTISRYFILMQSKIILPLSM